MYFRKTCQTRAGKRQHDKLAKRTEKQKTEKSKRWLHACGRKDFSRISDTKKDTYICSLHFAGEHGPTDENPDPIKGMFRRDMDYFLRKEIY